MRKCLSVATLAVASFALAGTAGAASTKDSFGLKGEVYAKGMKIEMKNANNRPLTTVRAGTYRIKIEDEGRRRKPPGATTRGGWGHQHQRRRAAKPRNPHRQRRMATAGLHAEPGSLTALASPSGAVVQSPLYRAVGSRNRPRGML
jgi:hypothetical protein